MLLLWRQSSVTRFAIATLFFARGEPQSSVTRFAIATSFLKEVSSTLTKLSRENTRDESRLTPDGVLEGELYFTHSARDWWELEKISDKDHLHPPKRL